MTAAVALFSHRIVVQVNHLQHIAKCTGIVKLLINVKSNCCSKYLDCFRVSVKFETFCFVK